MSGDLEGSSVLLAALVLGDVLVILLLGNTISLDVVEGVRRPSTVAALVSLGARAIDQLLF